MRKRGETERQSACGCARPAEALCPAESRAVAQFRGHLEVARGRPVEETEALALWMRERSDSWRRKYLEITLREEFREIQKHKWIESEKRGRDLGSTAVYDWINRYARAWREWWEEKELGWNL